MASRTRSTTTTIHVLVSTRHTRLFYATDRKYKSVASFNRSAYISQEKSVLAWSTVRHLSIWSALLSTWTRKANIFFFWRVEASLARVRLV